MSLTNFFRLYASDTLAQGWGAVNRSGCSGSDSILEDG